MARDLATGAELAKLARTLGTGIDDALFAANLRPEDTRRLRERISAALHDEHRPAFQRVAAITRLLPTLVNVRIALRAYPPMLVARVAAEMAPDRAAELANRMPVEYLAEACLHLDPRRSAPLMSRIQRDRAVAVALELVRRGEYITLGHLVDGAPERLLRDVAEVITDEALLRIGFYVESADQLTRSVTVLPAHRLRSVVHTALSGPDDLRSCGLALIGRLTDDRLRGELADYAAEAGDEELTTMLRTAISDGALRELLVAVAAMGERAQRRVLELPVLADHEILLHLIRATAAHDLLRDLFPLTERMTGDLAHRLAAVTEPTARAADVELGETC